jgi:head-tail adaptor
MFDTTDLANMRETQTDHMMDECYIQALTQTTNTYGEVVNSWADSGSALACGLDMRPGSETRGPEKTVVQYDATLRLGITNLTEETQRIRITKRFGESITALVYDIAAPVQRGPSGIRILLNKVSV